MLELIKMILGMQRQDSVGVKEVLPILKAILHSDALTEIVRATGSPIDDLVLRVLRALIPRE